MDYFSFILLHQSQTNFSIELQRKGDLLIFWNKISVLVIFHDWLIHWILEKNGRLFWIIFKCTGQIFELHGLIVEKNQILLGLCYESHTNTEFMMIDTLTVVGFNGFRTMMYFFRMFRTFALFSRYGIVILFTRQNFFEQWELLEDKSFLSIQLVLTSYQKYQNMQRWMKFLSGVGFSWWRTNQQN